MDFCEGQLEGLFQWTGMTPYNISKECDGGLSETLCYPVTRGGCEIFATVIASYLDRPEVRTLLRVDPSGDHSTQHYVAALLERGIRVLIYVGTYDWICNWVGNEHWTLAMEWSGQSEFLQQELKLWGMNEGKSHIGLTQSTKGLTFGTVEGAGHMVPYDKPKEALELIQRWLSRK
ncbi:Alpha/Beta hydrolase protein [Mycena galopus ATCC 62051]|nr:Alpha/Beta hydrolase protein [Mycena galopus ATCC 62051]